MGNWIMISNAQKREEYQNNVIVKEMTGPYFCIFSFPNPPFFLGIFILKTVLSWANV